MSMAGQHAADPLLIGTSDDAALTQRVLRPLWSPHPALGWLMIPAALGSLVFITALCYTFVTGIGVWGNNIPVGWAFAITNFVWWIGIGHAGTFISAILYLLQQEWRTSINRIAEAMTLFAVVNAGLFPIAHLGRPWFFYWLAPYPATMELWPQFRSSLTWDVAAISTYGTVSFLFWYLGLLPDLATARDTAPTRLRRRLYGLCALGWRGAASHWRSYRIAYLLLAGLATPLVVSVHSIVSLDFAVAKQPGWHSTIFPPYFVAGAIFSGFAMVLTLVIPLRALLRLQDVITMRHIDNMAKVLLATGSIVAYSYLLEPFTAWYSGDPYERYIQLVGRPAGPFAWVFWLTIVCNVLVPQVLWLRSLRRNLVALLIISLLVQLGMWSERFVIVVTSLQRGALPSSWSSYSPTLIDACLLFGSMSLFLFLFLVFVRFVPFIALSELKLLRRKEPVETQVSP
jgi:molybdopterin-containing oxidoreductase family membrane subunit